MDRKEKELATAFDPGDKKQVRRPSGNSSNANLERKASNSGGLNRVNSGMSGAQDSQYNFKIGKPETDEAGKEMAEAGASGPFKRQTSNAMGLNETKHSNQQSALSGNKKFAEDVDEESDEDSSDDNGPKVYMYKCPVFRVSIS